MKEILKYSSFLFLYALSHSYIVTCFAIDLKLQGYEEQSIGLGLSFWGVGVIIGALLHNRIRKRLNLFTTIFIGSIMQFLFSLIFLFDQNTQLGIALKNELDQWLETTGAKIPEKDPLHSDEEEEKWLRRHKRKMKLKVEKRRMFQLDPNYLPNEDWWGSTID